MAKPGLKNRLTYWNKKEAVPEGAAPFVFKVLQIKIHCIGEIPKF
jgi:hypothetical protein